MLSRLKEKPGKPNLSHKNLKVFEIKIMIKTLTLESVKTA